MRSENHELENLRDQYKQLAMERQLAIQNKEMFYRLWSKWATETRDIQIAIIRVKIKIEEMKRHPQ